MTAKVEGDEAMGNTLLATVEGVLKAEGLEGQTAAELSGIRLGFTGENGNFLCFIRVDEGNKRAVFYAIAPFSVAKDRRADVALLVTRANFDLPQGCFELDLDDGELRFRTTAHFGKGAVDTSVLAASLWGAVAAMDRYLPALMATAQQNLAPEKAIALVESGAVRA